MSNRLLLLFSFYIILFNGDGALKYTPEEPLRLAEYEWVMYTAVYTCCNDAMLSRVQPSANNVWQVLNKYTDGYRRRS